MIAQPDLLPSAGAAIPTLRPCFSSLGCPDFSLTEAASLALEFGIPCLELRALENRTDLPKLLGEFPGGWAGAREYLRVRDLQVQVLGTSFKLAGGDDAGWAELLAFAELAEALQTPWLRAFGGGVWGRALVRDDYQMAAENLRRWDAERRSRGWTVDLLMETHDAFSASAPCLHLMEEIGRPVPLIWDSHHTWRLGGEQPVETWEVIGPCVKHVHWKDSVGVPSARHPFTYVRPGEGEMPFNEVMDLLLRDGFSGAVSLEWEKLWHPYLPSLADALRSCRGGRWLTA